MEDRSIRNTIYMFNRISHDATDFGNSEFACQLETAGKPLEDDNFYKSAAAQFIEGVLTVTTGVAIYKVKPRRHSEENEENKDLLA